MKRAVLLALLLPAIAGAAFMDPPQTHRERCEPIEYVELKDMPEDALRAAFCDVERLAKQRALEAHAAAQMATAIPDRSRFATQEAFARFAAQCREQAVRIGALYERRFGRPASCNTPAVTK